MLDSLITSKTRIKLLLKFFLNPENRSYLRSLAGEFGESTNGIRIELDRLTNAGFLRKENGGKTKFYSANTSHPLYPEINSLVRKYLGIDKVVDDILSRLGSIDRAYITGDYAKGIDSGIIDLIIQGDIDKNYLSLLVEKAEKMIKRKIRVLLLTGDEMERLKEKLDIQASLLVWNSGGM